ncbi:MAG: hypothetical protein M1829_000914 [Trizodia sp. TS-e1964]|nr:MAG: hypothetical protein M1829_000914 [Trizodia sp. TS-e1964]
MSKRGRGGASGNKLKMTLGLPVGAVMNCCDNSGARNLYIISVKGIGARLNRLPAAGVGDMVMATVKKGKPELRKKVMPAVVVRQSKPWRRTDGIFLYFEDNAGVIVNAKGEMKGSAITGPVAIASTLYLYFYPVFHLCSFRSPDASPPFSFLNTLKYQLGWDNISKLERTPFRLLAFGDPQLEGQSSIPELDPAPFNKLFPQNSDNISVSHRFTIFKEGLLSILKVDFPRTLTAYRKRLDLIGNDLYLAHIYRTLYWWTSPTHTTVLGDLLGSQWIDDLEFEKRGNRFWQRVFNGSYKVPQNITQESTAEVLGSDKEWKRRLLNVAGNHDVGYAGDMTQERVERFEKIFGRTNWNINFQLNHSTTTTSDNEHLNPPSIRLIVLNTMNLDTPALDPTLQSQTYNFINEMISQSQPVEKKSAFTILLTHIPLHKAAGTCVDPPFFEFYKDGGVREQNHLSYNAGKGILEGIFGLSSNRDAPGAGHGRPGLILTGHDHEGCDVYHYVTRSLGDALAAEQEWQTIRWSDASDMINNTDIPGIREITVRSMMGEFGGYAGLLSLWFDKSLNNWHFEFDTCALGTQHIWWTVYILDFITLLVGAMLVIFHAGRLFFALNGVIKLPKSTASLKNSNHLPAINNQPTSPLATGSAGTKATGGKGDGKSINERKKIRSQ